MHDSNSDSGITLIFAGIGTGIKIRDFKRYWNWSGISGLLAGIGTGTGIKLWNQDVPRVVHHLGSSHYILRMTYPDRGFSSMSEGKK